MSKEVNLIASRRKESSATYRQAGTIKKIAFALLIFCVIASVALFSINSTSDLGGLTQKEKSLSQTLLVSQKKIVKIALIKERLSSIAMLTKNNASYEDLLVSVSNALSKDSAFDSFEITKKTLSVTISSPSLISVNSFLEYVLGNINKKQYFQKVTISSLIGDVQTGKYILTLDITLL